MADAADLKSASRKGVWVRIPPWAPVYRVLTGKWRKAFQRGQTDQLPPFCPHLFENGGKWYVCSPGRVKVGQQG